MSISLVAQMHCYSTCRSPLIMLFTYDKDVLAYCCHAEEPINFQSLFFPIKMNEKRNTRVLREISNLALSCIARMCSYSIPSYTPPITHSCTMFAMCACYGSPTTDCDKVTANQLTANNTDWLRRAILNIFLLSPEPSCPNPHFVTKSLRRKHATKLLLRGQFVCGQFVAVS